MARCRHRAGFFRLRPLRTDHRLAVGAADPACLAPFAHRRAPRAPTRASCLSRSHQGVAPARRDRCAYRPHRAPRHARTAAAGQPPLVDRRAVSAGIDSRRLLHRQGPAGRQPHPAPGDPGSRLYHHLRTAHGNRCGPPRARRRPTAAGVPRRHPLAARPARPATARCGGDRPDQRRLDHPGAHSLRPGHPDQGRSMVSCAAEPPLFSYRDRRPLGAARQRRHLTTGRSRPDAAPGRLFQQPPMGRGIHR